MSCGGRRRRGAWSRAWSWCWSRRGSDWWPAGGPSHWRLIRWGTGLQVPHLLLEPAGEVGDLRVDPQGILSSTPKSPADHTNEGHCHILVRICSNQRTSTVSLTSILATSHEPAHSMSEVMWEFMEPQSPSANTVTLTSWS